MTGVGVGRAPAPFTYQEVQEVSDEKETYSEDGRTVYMDFAKYSADVCVCAVSDNTGF